MKVIETIFFNLSALSALLAAALVAAVAAGLSFSKARRVLVVALCVALLLHLVLFLQLTLAYVHYPYEGKSVVEGVALYNAMQYMDGKQPYQPPQEIPFRSLVYPPGHELMLAGFLSLTGPSLYAARLFSLLCALGTAIVSGLAVWQHTRHPFASLFGGLLVTAFYGVTGQWLEQVRCDAPAQFLIVLGLYAADRAIGRNRMPMVALVVLVLAVYTKQVAVFAPAAVAVALWFRNQRQALVWTGGFLAAVAAVYLAMETWSGGWFSFYVLRVPFSAGIEWGQLRLASDYFGVTWVLLAGISGLVVLALRTANEPAWEAFRPGRTLVIWALALPPAIVLCVMQSVKWGGALNAFIPLTPLLAVMGAVAFHGLMCRFSRPGWAVLLVLIAALMQAAMLTYAPTWPSPADRQAQDQIARLVREARGDVFVSVFSSQTYLNGKPYFGDDVCIGDLKRAGVWRGSALIDKIRAGGFSRMILRPRLEPPDFADAVNARYNRVGVIPLTGKLSQWRYMEVYEPKVE